MTAPATTGADGGAPLDDQAFTQEAVVSSFWVGSRLLLGGVLFLYAGFAFAYFYLRSVNSVGDWRPAGQQPPLLLGALSMALFVGCAALYHLGLRRMRAGSWPDWFVAGWLGLLLGLIAVGLQIWQLTRLGFYPGSSGYASVFVGWSPVHVVVMLGALYWMETLLARSMRDRTLLPVSLPPLAPGVSLRTGDTTEVTPARGVLAGEAGRFVANSDACGVFLVVVAVIGFFFFLLFYII